MVIPTVFEEAAVASSAPTGKLQFDCVCFNKNSSESALKVFALIFSSLSLAAALTHQINHTVCAEQERSGKRLPKTNWRPDAYDSQCSLQSHRTSAQVASVSTDTYWTLPTDSNLNGRKPKIEKIYSTFLLSTMFPQAILVICKKYLKFSFDKLLNWKHITQLLSSMKYIEK